MTPEDPALEEVPAQPYVAVRSEVTMDNFRSVIDQNFGRPFAWLGENGLRPAGPPFIRYLALDKDGNPSRIEFGVTMAERVEPGDGLVSGDVPAGLYVAYTHVGPYQHAELEDLAGASERVLGWVEREGLSVAAHPSGEGRELEASFEFYLTDPSSEEDFTKWVTRILMLVES